MIKINSKYYDFLPEENLNLIGWNKIIKNKLPSSFYNKFKSKIDKLKFSTLILNAEVYGALTHSEADLILKNNNYENSLNEIENFYLKEIKRLEICIDYETAKDLWFKKNYLRRFNDRLDLKIYDLTSPMLFYHDKFIYQNKKMYSAFTYYLWYLYTNDYNKIINNCERVHQNFKHHLGLIT